MIVKQRAAAWVEEDRERLAELVAEKIVEEVGASRVGPKSEVPGEKKSYFERSGGNG